MNQSATTAPDTIPFAKMNGIGNAILVVDMRGRPPLDGATARRIGGEPGLGFDQLMAIGDARSPGTDAFVEIFNIDGTRAGACGNGTRCVAWFLLEGSDRRATMIETSAGRLDCRRDAEWEFTVDMGAPRFGWRDIPLRDAIEDTRSFAMTPASEDVDALGPATAVSMGNPHAIFWIDPAGPKPDLARLGPGLERHPMFPDRANISLARVLARDHIGLDVWERGAGLTRACGSAACASLVAAVRNGLADRRAAVTLPGGTLSIEWREADGHVLMTGLVELEHRGFTERNRAGLGK